MARFFETCPQSNSVYYLTEPNDAFESVYLAVRKKEHRLYTDQEVIRLPRIKSESRHYPEWAKRRRSFRRLMSYLDKEPAVENVLDLGCGMGRPLVLAARRGDPRRRPRRDPR